MSTPATLPANFFEKQKGQASPPKTLPANFDFKTGKAPEVPKPDTSAERGAAQATGLRPQQKSDDVLSAFLASPQGKAMEKSNVDAAKFGAEALPAVRAIKALFRPTMSMVPGAASKILGPDGKPIVSMIEKEGASAAGKAAGMTKEAVRKVLTWANKNPTQAYIIYKGLEELGIAPHKAMKMLHVVSKD